MWLRALADSDASCGGKAVGLARLIAAGLRVPDGFVIEDGAFRSVVGPLAITDAGAVGHALAEAAARVEHAALPQAFVDEVTARAAALGTLAVRSSATIEDGAAGAAAGVFSSVTAVTAPEVWPAIRAVWTSALTPLAAAYARRRGGEIAIGVIVQRHVAGERLTIYTRPPGQARNEARNEARDEARDEARNEARNEARGADADEVWIQRAAQVRRLSRGDADPVVALALRAEQAIGAERGADVELVEAPDGTLWVVQARPIVHPAVAQRTPPPPAILAPLVADGRRWVWDVTHNPDPLSAAQASLVERVDRAAIAPWSMRVCAGYLYTAPRIAVPPIAVADRAELEARAAELEARIARTLAGEAASLDDAIAAYLAFYAIWAGELVPLIAAARAAPARAPLEGARPSAVEATLLAAARGELDEATAIARLAPLAPAWDVAVPTFGERPWVIREAITRARSVALPRLAGSPAGPPSGSPDGSLDGCPDGSLDGSPDGSSGRDARARDLARAGADLAERDDHWFAQAQARVRRALLRHAAERAIGDDVFWLSLDDARRTLTPEDAHRRAAAARAASERAARWSMPRVVGGEAPEDGARPALHGTGSGPRVTGRIVRFGSLASAVAVGPGDVIVTRAITPALAVFVVGCAAIISETGGPLDHGAAIARELGIPCVVGCHDAWSLLAEGAVVTVDGDAGVVTLDS